MSTLNNRIEKLPILLQELRFHLLNYDEVRNPQVDLRGDERHIRRLKEQEEDLKIIEAIEKFITHVMISGDCLFSNSQEWQDERKLVPRTIEKLFFDFNRIYEALEKNGNIGNPFSSDIRYSLDLCLFRFYFLNLDRHFYVSPRESLIDYNRWRRATYALPSKRALTHSTFSSCEPKLSDRERLFNASELFLKEVLDVSHKKLVSQVASKNSARFKNANEYISNLFEQNGSLTFIALDLCFPFECRDLESQKKYLKNFKNRIRNHALFTKMKGYIGKWEYSKIKGIYVRMIFIFTKIEKHMLDTIPELIGGFWKNLSDNKTALFHYAYLSAGKTKLNKTIYTISSKHEQLRQELEWRTIFYLTYSQSYFLCMKFVPARLIQRTITRDDLPTVRRELRSFEVFFKGELPKALVEAKKVSKSKRKLDREIKDRDKYELQVVKDKLIYLMNKD